MTYDERDFIQLSALQHFIFCRRQFALIHIEQVWRENLLTAEGRILHERVHDEGASARDGVRVERGTPIRSVRLGLSGIADVVEFHKVPKCEKWQPFPVEYKHGKPKRDDSDKVQLCAQALCLEEMLDVAIVAGAIFYGKTRRRLDVVFDDPLRNMTEDAAKRMHEFMNEGKTPKPEYSKKCEFCSLVDVCMPEKMERTRSVKDYLRESRIELEKAS